MEKTLTEAREQKTVALRNLFKKLVDHGIYLESLDPYSLVWEGNQWTIVKPMKLRTGLSVAHASSLYAHDLEQKWAFLPAKEFFPEQVAMAICLKSSIETKLATPQQ